MEEADTNEDKRILERRTKYNKSPPITLISIVTSTPQITKTFTINIQHVKITYIANTPVEGTRGDASESMFMLHIMFFTSVLKISLNF